MQKSQVVILVVDDDPQVRHSLASDLQKLYQDAGVIVEPAENVTDGLQALAELDLQHTDIPLIVSDYAMPGLSGIDLFRQWRVALGHKDTRLLLLSGQVDLEQISVGLNAGLIDGYLLKPYQADSLAAEVKKAVSQYYLDFHPERLNEQPKLVSHLALHQALEKALQDKLLLSTQMNQIKKGAFAGDLDAQQVFNALAKELLDWLQRQNLMSQIFSFSEQQVILQEGEKNECLWFVLEGVVLQEKMGKFEKVELMEQGAGEFLGLLSILSQRGAFSTLRAKTSCRLARLSREDLDNYLADPQTNVSLFFRSLLLMLHNRVTKVSETKVALQDAHRELNDTQVKLVEAEKMATLGILTAGVAHELNNPAAALSRACEHIRSGLLEIFDEKSLDLQKSFLLFSEGARVLQAAFQAVPVSTTQLRSASKEFGQDFDPFYARKLAELALTVPGVWPLKVFHEAKDHTEKLNLIGFFHRFFELGIFLSNINSCSERIASLVKGMKNYAKAENSEYALVDVREGMEDTFVVLGNRLKRYEVEKVYPAEIPKVWAVASKLNQVWTNLLSNACDATEAGKKIIVCVSADESFVYVSIKDEGTGIPPDIKSRIFEPRFTTKKGNSEHFGLGLGLAIVQKIVAEHQGNISLYSLDSRSPAGTEFVIQLPIAKRP